MAFETIKLERKENIGILTINRPKAMNALNHQVIESYKKIVQNVEDQKIIVVEGSGHFIDENLLKALSSQL